MSQVVLATSNRGFEQRARDAVAGSGELVRWEGDITAADVERAVVDLTKSNPRVVALGPGIDTATAMKVAGAIDRDHPEICVIVITEGGNEIWEQAIRAGVRDVVSPTASTTELATVFDRAVRTAEVRRANLIEEVAPAELGLGRVITILAPKGGSGKTALAVNTAVALAQRHPRKVAILDLDLLFGDVTNALLLSPEHTIADAIGANHLEPTTMKVLLTPRGKDLFVLSAPDEPSRGEEVSEVLVTEAIDLLKREFDYVIIDTAAGLTETTLAAIEHSDDLLVICDMSVAAVRGLRKVLDALERLDLTDAVTHFILNRADSKVGITLEDVESTVGKKVDVRIPSSRLVPRSMNEGTPLMESAPRAPVTRAYLDVVDLLSPVDPKAPGFRRKRRGE